MLTLRDVAKELSLGDGKASIEISEICNLVDLFSLFALRKIRISSTRKGPLLNAYRDLFFGCLLTRKKIIEIEQSIQRLRELPRVGTVGDGIALGLRTVPATGKSVICFMADDDNQEVRILAIGHVGSDWTKS